MLFAIGAVAVTRRLVGMQPNDADVIGNYLQTLGTIYAVLLAFAVFVVWTQFSDTRARLEQEVNDLFDILRVSRALPDPIGTAIREQLRHYVDNLLAVEWAAFARLDASGFERGWRISDGIWSILQSYEPGDERCRALYAELLARFNDLSDSRTARITSGLLRIPLPLRLVLYAGAVSTVGSMLFFQMNSVHIHELITALLAGAVSHVLLVVEDLDAPFQGVWQLSREPFERLLRHIGETRSDIATKGE